MASPSKGRSPSSHSPSAKFLTGSTMSHVLTMTLSSSIGLVAVFSVDLIDLFFLSQLEDKSIQAALGFTGTILFATISLGIGLSIASAATVARAAGEQDEEKTNGRIVNNLIYSLIVSIFTAIFLFLTLPSILTLLGAKGHVLDLSMQYLQILVPTMPLFALSICSAAMLRSLGDAKRSAYVTIGGGLTNAILDPIFIFALAMGMNGAAIATALARLTMVLIGFYGLFYCHKTPIEPTKAGLKADLSPFTRIAIPAILTNIATPIGNGYVTYVAAGYGNGVVAAWGVIARIVPLGFCAVFALSGSIGPIIGQNIGGQKLDRVKQTLTDAVKFNTLYTLVIWLVLVLSTPWIIQLMQLQSITADLVAYFCYWLSPGFGMIGFLFIANAAFNNMDKPHYSTWLNWTRATLGTIPFVHVGAYFADSHGLITGQIAGGALIALFSIVLCYREVEKLSNQPSFRS